MRPHEAFSYSGQAKAKKRYSLCTCNVNLVREISQRSMILNCYNQNTIKTKMHGERIRARTHSGGMRSNLRQCVNVHVFRESMAFMLHVIIG